MKTPGSSSSRRQHRTNSVASVKVRQLPTLGRLGRPLQKISEVNLTSAGKRKILIKGSEDHPVASLFLPPQLTYDRLVQKLIKSSEVEDSRHLNVNYRIAEKNNLNSSVGGGSSMLFSGSSSTSKRTSLRQGKLKLSKGKLHVSGVAKPGGIFSKSSKDSKDAGDRKVSVASIQMSDLDEVLFNTFYIAQLFQIKFSPSAVTKLSLLFYSSRNNEENFKARSWKTLPEFDEVVLKFENSEATKSFIKDLLRHTEYCADYLTALVDQVLDNVDNDRVEFSSEKGQATMLCAMGRMRLALDLKAIVYGFRSTIVVEAFTLLSQTIERHGDKYEESQFWKEIAEKLESVGEPEADAKKDLLAMCQRELRDQRNLVTEQV